MNFETTQFLTHTASPIDETLLPPIQMFEGWRIQEVVVREGYPLTLIVSGIQSELGQGRIFLLGRRSNYEMYGINVPVDFATIAINDIGAGFVKIEFFYPYPDIVVAGPPGGEVPPAPPSPSMSPSVSPMPPSPPAADFPGLLPDDILGDIIADLERGFPM